MPPAAVLIPVAMAGAVAAAVGVRALRRKRRLAAIANYDFPPSVLRGVLRRWPQLSRAQGQRVLEGLRQYLEICARARLRTVAMPSVAVDEAWHGFILSTHHYEQFCRAAFGIYLHHAPDADMPNGMAGTVGMRRCWRIACAIERIDPLHPARLPLVFALDAELAIPEGRTFQLDCSRAPATAPGTTGTPSTSPCATHLGCSSDSGGGCSSGSAWSCAGHAASDGGGGGSDSGSDGGGSGCGGGCGGGGD